MRHYRKNEITPTTVDVFDTPSGMGGSFTVSLIEDHGETAIVRVWYGRATETGWQAWRDWDGFRFSVPKAKLTNPHSMRLVKRSESYYD